MIDTFFTILRKSMVATMFVIFAFAVTYIPQPATDGGYHNVEQAQAGGFSIVQDPWALVQTTATAVQTAASFVLQQWFIIKEQVLDGIAWVIAKEILADMMADIVDWINSGFEGNPAFVQDLGGFMQESADRTIGGLLEEIALGDFLCSPFQFDVGLAVAIQADIDSERRQVRCTLSDITANIDDFISGDFREGGWDGWFAMTQNPNNTPYGAIVSLQSEARSRVIENQQNERSLLDFGSGFRSFEVCDDVPGPNGSTVEECYITTPGDIFAGQINKALGGGQDQLVEADEFNEIVGALVSRLASSVLSSAGLLGQSGGGGFDRYSRATTFEDDVRSGNATVGSGGGSTPPGGPGLGGAGGSTAGADYINTALADQQGFLIEVGTYINQLTGFINNPRNSDANISVARVLLTEARNLQTRVQDVITNGSPLQTEYNQLEAEYPTASLARQQEISQRQADIVLEFGRLNALTQQEFNVYASRWDQMLDQNVGPLPNACDVAPFSPGCPCTIDINDPDCNFNIRFNNF